MDIINYTKLFVIVGVGGTGSLIARDIPKLIIGSNAKMLLADGDRVEKKNMKRQCYQEQDIGENKAIALSKKINALYGPVSYAYDKCLTKDELYIEITKHLRKGMMPVILGCVDNDATRILLEQTFRRFPNAVYLDSANSEYEGNVYVAVRDHGDEYGAVRGGVYELENEHHPLDKSCQEQASTNTQFLVTNTKMATVLLEHCDRIMKNEAKVGVTSVKRFETVHYS